MASDIAAEGSSEPSWFDRLREDEPPEVLYHYTSQRGLLGILEKRALWATHIRYLNDSTEYHLAFDLAKEILDARAVQYSAIEDKRLLSGLADLVTKMQVFEAYVFSLSSRDDQLSQWRGYCTSGPGYSVGIRSAAIRDAIQSSGTALMRCIYDESDQRAVLGEVITNAVDGFMKLNRDQSSAILARFLGEFSLIAPLIKHHKFREEDEWRLVGPRGKWLQDIREGRSMLLPYIKIALLQDSRHAFSRIVVGPTPHMTLSAESARTACRVFGSPNTEVVESMIPYRSW